MGNKEFQEKKDKILDKIFIGTGEHNKILEKKIKLLEKENEILIFQIKQRTSEILGAIEDIMKEHEMQFREKKQDAVSAQTINYSLTLWDYLRKNLHNNLYPNLKRIIISQKKIVSKLKKEYKDLLNDEQIKLKKLKNLKKEKKKEIRETRNKIKKIMK